MRGSLLLLLLARLLPLPLFALLPAAGTTAAGQALQGEVISYAVDPPDVVVLIVLQRTSERYRKKKDTNAFECVSSTCAGEWPITRSSRCKPAEEVKER